MYSFIKIRGSRVHNLKNVNVNIPLKKITCLIGPSGSGKTSLAIHTLLTESKRRFVLSLPNSVKLFTEKPSPVDVDELYPVLPSFGLYQHNPILSARSTVTDILNLTDEFQKLFSLLSHEYCSNHKIKLEPKSLKDQICESIKFDDEDILHLIVDKELYKLKLGYQFLPSRVWNSDLKKIEDYNEAAVFWELGRIKGKNINDVEKFFKKNQSIQIMFDHFQVVKSSKLGTEIFDIKYSSLLSCPKCKEAQSISKSDFLFSPNNALGACKICHGFGGILQYDEKKYIDEDNSIEEDAILLFKLKKFQKAKRELLKVCSRNNISTIKPYKELSESAKKIIYQGSGTYPGIEGVFNFLESKKYKPVIKMLIRYFQSEVVCKSCNGTRINPLASRFYLKISNELYNLPMFLNNTVCELKKYFEKIPMESLPKFSISVVQKISKILSKAESVGLGHLPLKRKAKSLSGGEHQRSLLVKFFSYDGTDSLFVLDEPSLGITAEQWPKVWDGISSLVDQGNTVIVIEHQDFFQKQADYVIELGPGSGKDGGEILYEGNTNNWIKERPKTVNSIFKIDHQKLDKFEKLILAKSPMIYGKEYSDVAIFKSAFHWVRGSTGTGKTSVMLKTLANMLHRKVHNDYIYDRDGNIKELHIYKDISSVIVADNNLKRYNSRSTVGSFTDLSLVVRKYFASTPQAKKLKLTESHFSTNSALGQCSSCQGLGVQVIEMQYMDDVIMECDDCGGVGIRNEYANISDGHICVSEAFQDSMNKILEFIPLTPKFKKIYQTLQDLKLAHLSLGRTMSSLSGGEKQRLNLVSQFLTIPKDSVLFFENLSFGLSRVELPSIASYVKSLSSFNNCIIMIDQNEIWSGVRDVEILFNSDNQIITKLFN